MISARLRKGSVEVRGETFRIREWTPLERAEFFKRQESDKYLSACYVVYACTLKDGDAQYFADEAAVRNEPAGVVDKIAEAILRLSGDEDDAKNG